MVQLQLICLLVGSFTFMTVKRQRQLYATGFDQRKAFPSSAPSHHGRDFSTGVTGSSSFSRSPNYSIDRVSTLDERVPLADESGIEIV